jgi:hypothetical protein
MTNFKTTRERLLAAEERIKELEEENRNLNIQLDLGENSERHRAIYAKVFGGVGAPFKLRRADEFCSFPVRGSDLKQAEVEAEAWIYRKIQYCRATSYELLDARGHVVAEGAVYPETIRFNGWSEAPFPMVAIGAAESWRTSEELDHVEGV